MNTLNAHEQTKRPFAVFDIDGTVIRWQLYHSIVSELGRRGHLPPAAMATIRASRMVWKRRTHAESFRDYEQTLIEIYHKALSDLSRQQYLEAVDAVFDEYKDQVYTFTRDLIRRLKAEGYLLFAISGSQQEIIAKLADYYGFDAAVGSHYLYRGQRFTGRRKVAVERSKDIILRQLIEEHQAVWQGSIGVGDSENDVPMLTMVERPIAFNPSRQLFDIARQKQWPVVLERKNVIYELRPGDDGSYILATPDA